MSICCGCFFDEIDLDLMTLKNITLFGQALGKTMLLPYIEIPILPETSLEFEDIIVGPTPNPDLAVAAVQRHLSAIGCTCVKPVSLTSIPFRTW